MLAYTEKIREIATRILDNGTVDMLIGFRRGSMPMMNEPCFITNSKDASSLVWDSNCRINLTNYITNRQEKLAIVAKGCDSRNIVTHIVENKIDRDNIYILGVPCTGMIDRKKVNNLVKEDIIKVSETETTIIVDTIDNSTVILDRKDILQNNCLVCSHPNPVISDEIIADKVEKQENIDKYALLEKIEAMNHSNRWKHFDDVLSPCIRCYACKNACPLCYCPVCFVDESRPQWVGKGQDPLDIRTFHFMRAYHCAGRCTDCGACEQACPVGIEMSILTKKLEKTCKELFGWEAGLSVENRPALDVYKSDDPEDFIK